MSFIKRKMQQGGQTDPPNELSPEELQKRYGSAVRPAYFRWIQKPGVKEAIQKAAQRTGVDPNTLAVSALNEGLDKWIRNKYVKEKEGYDQVEGFYDIGLDTFGERYQQLKDQGYLPEDFTEEDFERVELMNEKEEMVTSANFPDLETALTAKGADFRSRTDALDEYAKEQNIQLDPEDRRFFQNVAYNAGIGNAQKMLSSYAEDNILEDSSYLQERPTEYWKEPYQYAQRRYQTQKAFEGENVFEPKSYASDSVPSLAPAKEQPLATGGYTNRMQDGGPIDPPDQFPMSPRQRVAQPMSTRAATIRERYPNVRTGTFTDDVTLSTLLRNKGVDSDNIWNTGISRSAYHPVFNQMIINEDNVQQGVMAELAHSVQDDRGEANALQGLYDLIRSGDLAEWVMTGSDPQSRYWTEGMIEYQAHKEIEPELWEEYDRIRKSAPEFIQEERQKRKEKEEQERVQQRIQQDKENYETLVDWWGEEEAKERFIDDYGQKRFNRIQQLNMNSQELGFGGFIKDNLGTIGTVVGAGAGAFVGNPMLGAKIGGMAGSMGQQALGDDKQQGGRPMRHNVTYAKQTEGRYAKGGVTKYLAGGSMSSIGQDAQQINGPRHENGGVQLSDNIEVEGGETMDTIEGNKEYVFSDRLMVPKEITGENSPAMTFAEYHKQLVEEGANPSEIDELASIQERVAGREGDNIEEPEQYIGPREERPRKTAGGGFIDRAMKKYGGKTEQKMQYGGQVVETVMAGMGQQQDDGPGFLRQALPYLPGAMNLARGAFESSEVSDVPYTPPQGRAEDTIQDMETDVDVGPQRAAVQQGLRSVLADPNASMNEKLAASSQAQQNLAQVESQAENRETQLRNQMLSQLAGAQRSRDQMISQGRTQAERATRRQQMKADEAQRNLIQTGLQQTARTYQKQQQYDDMLKMDAMRLDAALAGMKPEIASDVIDRIWPNATAEQRQVLDKYRRQ